MRSPVKLVDYGGTRIGRAWFGRECVFGEGWRERLEICRNAEALDDMERLLCRRKNIG